MPEKNYDPHLGKALDELLKDVEESLSKAEVLRAEVEGIREDFYRMLKKRQLESIEEVDPEGLGKTEEPVTSLLAGSLEERTRQYEEWVKTVREPASEASEGVRILQTKDRGAYAKYEIASLPNGQWTIHTSFSYHCGNSSGNATPWSQYPTREECVEEFVDRANRFFHPEIDSTGNNRQRLARKEMLEILKGGLFGFVEPEPEK